MANTIKFSLFDVVECETTNFIGSTFKYPKICKTGDGYIDIVKDFYWKNNVSNNIDEVPSVTLKEYTLKYGMWANNLASIINQATQFASNKTNLDPYSTLYFGEPTGFNYRLPYLLKSGSSIRGDVSNKWSEISNPIGDILGAVPVVGSSLKRAGDLIQTQVQNAANFLTPGYGAEKVYNFAGTTPKSILITFPLYNTYNEESAMRNFSFVNLLSIQNLKTRTSYLTYIPPKLYTVDSNLLGGIYIPVAFISNLKIDSIGTTRKINEYTADNSRNGVLIPEAYRVSISLTEILPESSNIMMGALGGDKVQVFNAANAVDMVNNAVSPKPSAIATPSDINAVSPKPSAIATPSDINIPSPNFDRFNTNTNNFNPTNNQNGSITNQGTVTTGLPSSVGSTIEVPAGALRPENFNNVPNTNTGGQPLGQQLPLVPLNGNPLPLDVTQYQIRL
jgi:hypothetical protein